MRNWGARGIILNPVHRVTFLQQRRAAIEVPTEDEVRGAYAALGVSASSPFHDVKKRYVELAKQHHPDVNANGGADASTRMTNINNAYATLSRFHKAGGVLHSNQQRYSRNCNNSSNTNNNESSHAYYSAQDEPYQPWHEDINPLIYEMMWDEMRRQAEGEVFARANAHEHKRRRNYQEQKQQQQQQQRHQQNGDAMGSASKKAYDESRRHSKGGSSRVSKTTTWPEDDLRAMVNMYQDGKSFEFIANALGKKTPDVLLEFNRWSEDNKRPSRPAHRRQRGYYYAESPDMEFADFGGDFDDPYGYGSCEDEQVDPEEVFFDGGAVPFKGGHYMSGHRPHRNGKSGGRGRHGSSHRHW